VNDRQIEVMCDWILRYFARMRRSAEDAERKKFGRKVRRQHKRAIR